MQHFHNKSCQDELRAGHATTTTCYSLVTFQLQFCYLAEICEVETCVHTRGCGADTPTLSLSCKQTVFVHLGGPNRLCLSLCCVMRRRRRRRCDMLPWKRGGMPLAAAFHHIQRNNKHNNVGGERESLKKKKRKKRKEKRIRSPLN